MFAEWEVWLRTDAGDKLTTKVKDKSDALRAVEAALEKFNTKQEDVRELRVKFLQQS